MTGVMLVFEDEIARCSVRRFSLDLLREDLEEVEVRPWRRSLTEKERLGERSRFPSLTDVKGIGEDINGFCASNDNFRFFGVGVSSKSRGSLGN